MAEAFGPTLNRQDWRTNWRTTAYAKCSDQALYFSGPTFSELLALSAADGRILWQHPYNNYQLVLLDDGLYALSGQIDNEVSRKFDPLTGKVLEELKLGRRACTRPTGALDAVFCRASGGSTRWDTATRPAAVDLADARPVPGRGHHRQRPALLVAVGLRLQSHPVRHHLPRDRPVPLTSPRPAATPIASKRPTPAGRRWRNSPSRQPTGPRSAPTTRLRPPPRRSSPSRSRRLWQYPRPGGNHPDGPHRGGRSRSSWAGPMASSAPWTPGRARRPGPRTPAGNIRFPPTIWQGRALVGSGDGFVYAFEAKTGRTLWRFRAAPVERRIPVYGQLLSTWPVASGVLVQDGVAYAAAGIVNYDGTHVYALDAATGRPAGRTTPRATSMRPRWPASASRET